MATCADCVHVEVCTNFAKMILDAFDVSEDDAQCLLKKCTGDATVCNDFADRARFVELPCMVGDKIYMLTEQTQKLGRKKITKAVIVECCVDNFRIGDAGYPSAALCDNENDWYYGVEPKMFGEIIFLSRETAERALKEREKNGQSQN